MDDFLFAVFLLVWLIPSLTLHEFGHAWSSDRLGDTTARRAGRLTLNPVAHIDPFGTLVLPGLLLILVASGQRFLPVFAYAKPTPFSPGNFRDAAKGTMWTALAGPLVNLILAVAAALLIRVLTPEVVGAAGVATQLGGNLQGLVGLLSPVQAFLVAGLVINVILFVFNLMPIPGLDGSKVVARFLPPRAREVYRGLDQYLALFILVIFFLFSGPLFSIIQGLGNALCGVIVGGNCI
jgi:Zn-dependent protease